MSVEEFERAGGCAFPCAENGVGGETMHIDPGMTLRDYFAGQALAGWMASYGPDEAVKADGCAELAYEVADAMLAARASLSAREGE